MNGDEPADDGDLLTPAQILEIVEELIWLCENQPLPETRKALLAFSAALRGVRPWEPGDLRRSPP